MSKSAKEITRRRKPSYNETSIFVEALDLYKELSLTIKNIPRLLQHTSGDMLLKDCTRILQLMKLCYDTEGNEKKKYFIEAKERISCIEVTIHILSKCDVISFAKTALLYKFVGSIQTQLRAWMKSIKIADQKEVDKEDSPNEDKPTNNGGINN